MRGVAMFSGGVSRVHLKGEQTTDRRSRALMELASAVRNCWYPGLVRSRGRPAFELQLPKARSAGNEQAPWLHLATWLAVLFVYRVLRS